MQSKLSFFGGAGAVTGSNFLLEDSPSQGLGAVNTRVLIDCGLYQSQHSCEETNWSAFPYVPKSITALVVTHAHIDHIGKIPRLVKEGFAGPIYSTEATKAIAGPMLGDALELLAREAERCGKLPMFGAEDITSAIGLWKGLPYHQTFTIGDYSVEFLNSGHILGSAQAHITRGGKKIVFTGDLGGGNSPLLPPCEPPDSPDYLVTESVYGDRTRRDEDRRERLENVIEDAAARGGVLLIPAFSTERTQDLLFEIGSLMRERRVPPMPVFADSPLAQQITEAYLQYPQYFDGEVRRRVESGENIFSFPELKFVHDARESAAILKTPGPKIVIAGSGMSNGGRVLAHEMKILPDPKATLLIVGYQAAGSLGRRLLEGQKKVKVQNVEVEVKCAVEAIFGYSAHMDAEELLEFANKASDGGKLKEVFVVMGEPAASAMLSQRIRDYLGVRATVPEAGESATIEL